MPKTNPAVRLLHGFETPADIALWKPKNARAALVRERATQGKAALRVEFLPADWPNIKRDFEAPQNWKAFGALAFDITNPGREAVSFNVRLDDDPAADGVNHCRTGGSTIEAGQSATFVMPLGGVEPMAVGMRGLPQPAGLPAGARSLGASGSGPFDPAHITAFQIFLNHPASAKVLILDNIRLLPSGRQNLERIVDAFGQYAHADWPGKLKHEAEFAARRAREEAEYKVRPALPDRDHFGGWASGPQLPATGFFRTAKHNGKWSLVTPEGRLFLSLGMDCVSMWGDTFTAGREQMFQSLPAKDSPLARHIGYAKDIHSGPVKEGATFDFYRANLERKYGPDYESAWRRTALSRLPAWGFNTVANWSDWRLREAVPGAPRVPYVTTHHIGGDHARLSGGDDYWGQMHDPFDPKFAQNAAATLRDTLQAVKNDPWCIGHFVDNELSWGGGGARGRYALGYGALAMEAQKSPAKRALVQQLKAKYGDAGRLNAAWGVNFAAWNDLNAPFKPQGDPNPAMRDDLSAFVKSLARQYFTVVRDEIKKLDPNHLYLGCRFAWHTPEGVEAAAEVCDVVSFNIYKPRVDAKEWEFLNALGKPAIIGEFHFGALDRGMLHTGLVSTPNQKARAAMYEDYVGSVLDHPALVGCHWFQYVDEPLTGRTFDGENYNIGFVTVTDTPYPEMVAAAKKVHAGAYVRRFGKGAQVTRKSR